MPTIFDLFGPLGSGAQRAVSLLLEGAGYWDIYRSLKSHFPSASAADIRATINLGRQALSAIDPLGVRGRYRIADIPIIGPRFTEVPQLSPSVRFAARGLVSWVDPRTGETRYSTAYYRYTDLPSRAQVERDLRSQAEYQVRSADYEGRQERPPGGADISVDLVAITRAY